MEKGKHKASYLKALLIAAAYILALPFLAFGAAKASLRYLHTLKRAITTSLVCSNCEQSVPLVGMWRCECGFTYKGHLMRPCPICHRVPKVARCFNCGITMQLM